MMDDEALLQYLMEQGDMAPEQEEIARLRARSELLRQQGQQMPEINTGGRIHVRPPRSAYLAPLLGTLGGLIGDYKATRRGDELRKRKDASFARFIGSRKPAAFPTRTPGYGVEDDVTGL